MKCHYEVLEIPRDATHDDIKKAYHKLALKWHPDKNIDSQHEAKIQFQLIQQAYEVLSNTRERKWYDSHRDDIVLGSTSDEDLKDNVLNLFKYFSSTCFTGYEDDENGFYAVYRRVFEKLAAEDAPWVKDESDEEIPGFGDSKISYEALRRFYAYWRSYATKRSYAWLDMFNPADAPNRQGARLIERENKRIRDKAKKERNEQVRSLVDFIKRRDKRIHKFSKLFEIKAEENKRKSQEHKKQQLLKRQKELQDQHEPEWSKFSNIQPELNNIEAAVTAEFGEESSDEESANSLYCIACTKIFKTHKAFSNHENSKKHKDNVLLMKVSMNEDDLFFESEQIETDDYTDEDTNSLPTGTKLATGPEMPDFLLNDPTNSKINESDAKASDEELISDSDLNSEKKSSKTNKSNDSKTCAKSATDEGYILNQPDEANKEDGYDSDTPNEELFSDHEDEVLYKSKKQKKKKNKNLQMPVIEDSDDENRETDLLMGLSKKQRKRQQKERVLLDKLSFDTKSISNKTNVNMKKNPEKSTSSSSERNQDKLNESEESPQETISPLPEKKKGKKAKELRKAQRQAAGEARETNDRIRKVSKNADIHQDPKHVCATCKQQFSSKNKLFEHLRMTKHSVYIPVQESVDRIVKQKVKNNRYSD
jgi:DnaJ family protein A protein 5